ncbi:hypothetical protein, partial [Litorimonas sp.]|uniref:hypothetical protein n=1 Tax=Litorimonas sp. TaxID=1892381 RepID=UPI003A8BE7DF
MDELETLGTGRSQWFFISSNVLRIHISKISTPTIGKFMTFSPVGATRSLAYRIKLYMINVKNVNDDFCVIYNIILKLFQRELIGFDKTNPKNLRKYFKFINKKGIKFPICAAGLHQLEAQNPQHNLCLNVWNLQSDTNALCPFYLSKNRSKNRCCVHMIMMFGGTTQRPNSHSVYITDMSAFLRCHKSGGQAGKKHLFCTSCSFFKTASPCKMRNHYRACT